ncbi:acetate and butyrate kinase [Sistotremastrum niveocremeum HHB9708]|uniref:Probable acetate kinase n=1 Tax=Sistotremastrum niveocremeum HHB9708 TaxID=1314777 RepID=A0A164MTU9_9AGAM|nr:acetate and butyrate kinase [Sistotremastrum niveocremeum HHB9708]
MPQLILSANSGSSSLKITVFEIESDTSNTDGVKAIAVSSTSNLSSSKPTFSLKFFAPPASDTSDASDASKDKDEKATPKDEKEEVPDINDHKSAFEHFLDRLKKNGLDVGRISHVCHRIVHGGRYQKPTEISEDAMHRIEALSSLAPLHNGPALSLSEACFALLPESQSITYFDSVFHISIPQHISSYAIDQKTAYEKGLKRYGFHGSSYSFINRKVAEFSGKVWSFLQRDDLNMLTMEKSYDTTMGLTPLDGLPGATRSGGVDPSLIFHYTSSAGRLDQTATKDLHVPEAPEHILNSNSGWKSITGTTNFGTITSKRHSSPPHALAWNIFVDRVIGYIGNYYVKLGGRPDALVFADVIGEKSADLRAEVVKKVECIGFEVDERNESAGLGVVEWIGKNVIVCQTDEQLEMAHQCAVSLQHW